MTDARPSAISIARLTTPIGVALLATDETGVLRAFNWTDYGPQMSAWLKRHYPATPPVEGAAPVAMRRAFEAYFAGEGGALAAVPWRAAGTAFQLGVWQALCAIPPGETLSYAGLAARIDRPTAMRAVGLANGANPVALVVPCHRVIGANKTLTGYGGGLHRKRWLLAHEGASFKDQLAA
ncbi:methylated-DNA--[protein]-cysteine S-methyltransferase [Phenylobacterium sp. LjRoot225]|uniref:methylated-DNA--[protein]-cysteine S-methyltransferase n=1 Tax=Phenylobacterium sp. LjRoot225 TaxID=3342285 RepID=UPI003ECF73BD